LVQSSEVNGPYCSFKGGAATTIDPNTPNAANTNMLFIAQPMV
jgi:hypothetical protein